MAALGAESETRLITNAQQGDRNAFGELIRRHHAGVVNVVYRMCGDVQLAEDAAQDAFIQAWLHLRSFRPGSSLRNWLFRIAVNAALDVLRGKETTAEALETLTLADAAADPEAALSQKEQAMLIQRAILSLTETSRAVLVLREYNDLTYQEIAAALDIPVGTVMSRLNHARGCLREILKPEFRHRENEND